MFGLFKPKAALRDLAREALSLSDEKAAAFLMKLHSHTPRKAPSDIELIKAGLSEFKPLWLAATCRLARHKCGAQAQRIALAAEPAIVEIYPSAQNALALAFGVVDRRISDEGAAGQIATDLFLRVYPEFADIKDKLPVLAGVELGSTVRYLEFLAQKNRIA